MPKRTLSPSQRQGTVFQVGSKCVELQMKQLSQTQKSLFTTSTSFNSLGWICIYLFNIFKTFVAPPSQKHNIKIKITILVSVCLLFTFCLFLFYYFVCNVIFVRYVYVHKDSTTVLNKQALTFFTFKIRTYLVNTNLQGEEWRPRRYLNC